MGRFGLCGPAYRSQSPNADAETCINWYSERVEQQGKSQYVLYPCPGTFGLFRGLGDGAVRAEITTRNSGSGVNRTFQVIGSKFYEITNNPLTATLRGAGILNDGQRVSICAGPTQVLFASAGTPYVFNMVTNTLVALAPAVLANVSFVGYSDGFFIALQKNSNQLNTSLTLDATTWPPTNFTAVSVFTDNVLSMLVDHRELFLWGGSKSIVYYDSGNLFPFDPNPSGIIEQGIVAPLSSVKADNSVFWLNGSERGAGIFFRTQGYLPVRVSDHGVEQAISKYVRIDDCVGYALEDKGHTFIVWTFPTANATWVLDVTTGFWHQRLFWNQAAARFDAHHSWGHTFNFGKHLLSDPKAGNIYDYSQNYLADDADLNSQSFIRRERIAPQISRGREWVFFPAVEIYVETGLGPEPPLLDGNGKARDPQLLLSWSDDGAHTFSNEYAINCGQAGKFRKRAIKRRLGKSRGRNFKIAASDPIVWNIVDGYIPPAQERYVEQVRKIT